MKRTYLYVVISICSLLLTGFLGVGHTVDSHSLQNTSARGDIINEADSATSLASDSTANISNESSSQKVNNPDDPQIATYQDSPKSITLPAETDNSTASTPDSTASISDGSSSQTVNNWSHPQIDSYQNDPQSTIPTETDNGSTTDVVLNRVEKTDISNGVCAHLYDLRSPYFEAERYFDLMKNAGINWVRVGISQPKYSWEFEPFLLQAHEKGIKVLAILGPLIVGHDPNFTLADWETAVHAVMEIFGDRVDAWEVWNEPNIRTFQIGYMDGTPEHYFDMVKSAYNIIKTSTSIPTTVVVGSLAPEAGCVEWTRRFWELGGENYCDAYGFHMYDPARDYMMDQIASVTEPKPIWITEVGADSLNYGLDGQAQRIAMRLAYFNENAEKYRIENAFWYCWMDYAHEGENTNVWGNIASKEDFFGLVTVDLNPKPAYDMYKSFAPPPTS